MAGGGGHHCTLLGLALLGLAALAAAHWSSREMYSDKYLAAKKKCEDDGKWWNVDGPSGDKCQDKEDVDDGSKGDARARCEAKGKFWDDKRPSGNKCQSGGGGPSGNRKCSSNKLRMEYKDGTQRCVTNDFCFSISAKNQQDEDGVWVCRCGAGTYWDGVAGVCRCEEGKTWDGSEHICR